MAYQRKTQDEFRLHVNYGYGDGWEHEVTEQSRKEIRARVKEYHENVPGCSVKWTRNRVPINHIN